MRKVFDATELYKIRNELSNKLLKRSQGPLGWTFVRKDYSFIFDILPTLKFREGYTIRAYRYVSKYASCFELKFWAVPVNEWLPQPQDCMFTESKRDIYPRPKCALGNLMFAIDGDMSFDSYISSSLLLRTIDNIKNYTSENWGLNVIIDDYLMKLSDSFDRARYLDECIKKRLRNREDDFIFTNLTKFNTEDWQWKVNRWDVDWSPTVEIENDIVRVTFYTYYGHIEKTIYKNVDIYSKGDYTFESSREKIAEGGEGYYI